MKPYCSEKISVSAIERMHVCVCVCDAVYLSDEASSYVECHGMKSFLYIC